MAELGYQDHLQAISEFYSYLNVEDSRPLAVAQGVATLPYLSLIAQSLLQKLESCFHTLGS